MKGYRPYVILHGEDRNDRQGKGQLVNFLNNPFL